MNTRHCRYFAAVVLAASILFPANPVLAATTNVAYGDFFFSPVVVTIHVGDTVNWTSGVTDRHTLLGTGSDPVCGGVNLPCSHTFNSAGNFPYECTLHFRPPLNMTGMVVVLNLPPPPPPVIITQPLSQTVLTNTPVTFSVTASNAATYQWQTNLVNLPGATNAALTLSNVSLGDSATYRVIVGNSSGSVASSNAVLLVLSAAPPSIVTQPQSQTVLTNTTATLSVTASNAASYQWQSNLVNIQGATNASLVLGNVVIGDSGDYRVIVSNPSSSVTSSVAVLLVGYPVSITQQPANMDVSAGTPVTLQVQAIGSPAPQYQWFLNDLKLPGQTNAALALEAALTNNEGAYSVVVSNAFGPHTSSNAVLTVEPLTSIIKEKLTVTVSPAGSGAVTPNLNGRSLIVAHSYTVAAVAGRGQAFANWSGIAQSQNRSLTFVMQSVSNATLTANFIPSPFASNGIAGMYNGLFWDTNHLSNETSGYFSATISANGVISGQVRIAGSSAAFTSNLHPDGSGAVMLAPEDRSVLVLTMQVDLSGAGMLTGTVSDAGDTFNAQLIACRAGFGSSHPAKNYDGFYTWVMPGGAGDAPGGYSFGTARVSPAGGVHLSAFMSDGAAAVASGALSANGQMPLYASLYGGKGSLLSWVSFSNSPVNISTNQTYWFKNKVTKGAYPNGFILTNLLLWMGAYPAQPPGTSALNTSNATVQISGADLAIPIGASVVLDSYGMSGSSGGVTVNICDGTTVFSGSFKDPASGKRVPFKGVVLHPVPAGYGFFISGGLSGAVFVEAQ